MSLLWDVSDEVKPPALASAARATVAAESAGVEFALLAAGTDDGTGGLQAPIGFAAQSAANPQRLNALPVGHGEVKLKRETKAAFRAAGKMEPAGSTAGWLLFSGC
jgi:hypothetical protein